MKISEIFGFGVDNHSTKAWEGRENKRCPFRDHSPCTKVSKVNPLGICSFSDGDHAAAVCPVRLLEGGRIFRDAGRLAFGEGVQIVNLLSKVAPFSCPIMTPPPAGRKDSWRGAAAGPARRTNHPNPFYADHPWLPFHRYPVRRSIYNQRGGLNLD